MEMVKKEILVITTKGCIGCDIQNRNVDEAIKQSKKHRITKVVKDWRKVDRTMLKLVNVKDYPSTVFLVNNEIRFRCTGSYPVPVLVRWIDLYMK